MFLLEIVERIKLQSPGLFKTLRYVAGGLTLAIFCYVQAVGWFELGWPVPAFVNEVYTFLITAFALSFLPVKDADKLKSNLTK